MLLASMLCPANTNSRRSEQGLSTAQEDSDTFGAADGDKGADYGDEEARIVDPFRPRHDDSATAASLTSRPQVGSGVQEWQPSLQPPPRPPQARPIRRRGESLDCALRQRTWRKICHDPQAPPTMRATPSGSITGRVLALRQAILVHVVGFELRWPEQFVCKITLPCVMVVV